ncbi:MAG: GTP 3',8-cyclase MoaA [Desulfovibrio sp.]|jgi:cyclic pyranopterin phosphate synthase|nr:GTP 3',8-cyclase MoaA [Desulfovibrio sp.]
MTGREAERNGIRDSRGRRIDYLRVSLTDRCSFRCLYCMPPEGAPYIPHAEILSYEELLHLCRIAASLGISRYKITGGEPLCRKDAVAFIRKLKTLPGVNSVSLTTNGALLAPLVPELAEAGVDGITVSLDAFTQETFSRVTRSDARLDDILHAMERSRNTGIGLKINMVPLKGINDAEIVPLTRYAMSKGCHIRFIELMPVGRGKDCAGILRVEVQAMLEKTFGPLTPFRERIGNGPAEYLRADGHCGGIGFIAPLSHVFCERCNRVRLTSAGFLKTCLHHEDGCDLKVLIRSGVSDAGLSSAIRNAIQTKPRTHNFAAQAVSGEETPFLMNHLGG